MTAAGYRQISLGHETAILVVPLLSRILVPANQLGRPRKPPRSPLARGKVTPRRKRPALLRGARMQSRQAIMARDLRPSR